MQGTGSAHGEAILIRSAAVTDIPAITSIYRVEVLHGVATFELDPPSEAEMERRFRTIVEAGYPYLVADLGATVVGFAYASAYRARPAYRFTVENSIYVTPLAQHRGVGRALLTELIGRATSGRYQQMVAVIGDSSNAASIQLHRAAGFTFAGVLHDVGYKHGRWLDSVLMQRPLGPGSGVAP